MADKPKPYGFCLQNLFDEKADLDPIFCIQVLIYRQLMMQTMLQTILLDTYKINRRLQEDLARLGNPLTDITLKGEFGIWQFP